MNLTRNELIFLYQQGGRTEENVLEDENGKFVYMFAPQVIWEKVRLGKPYINFSCHYCLNYVENMLQGKKIRK